MGKVRNKVRTVRVGDLVFSSSYNNTGHGKALRVSVGDITTLLTTNITDRKKLRQLADLFAIAAEHGLEKPQALDVEGFLAKTFPNATDEGLLLKDGTYPYRTLDGRRLIITVAHKMVRSVQDADSDYKTAKTFLTIEEFKEEQPGYFVGPAGSASGKL